MIDNDLLNTFQITTIKHWSGNIVQIV